MTITLILVVLAFLALAFLIRLAKGRVSASNVLESPTEHIRSVDV